MVGSRTHEKVMARGQGITPSRARSRQSDANTGTSARGGLDSFNYTSYTLLPFLLFLPFFDAITSPVPGFLHRTTSRWRTGLDENCFHANRAVSERWFGSFVVRERDIRVIVILHCRGILR